jgi:hypothetical protein
MAKKTADTSIRSDTAPLRQRIRRFYRHLNHGDWAECFAHLDPRLRHADKVHLQQYRQVLMEFQDHYGTIDIWYLRVSLHAANTARTDRRTFAYVYILWQDAHKGLHLFRERWVKDHGRWYSRVVGLVVHERGHDSLASTGT